MKILKTLFALILFGVMSVSLLAQNPYMVKDIYSGASDGWSQYSCGMNGICYFSAIDGTDGWRVLWRSDGTESGTWKVKNVYSSGFTTINNMLYFSGNEGSNGQEPWKSDGSANGTVMIKNIASGKNKSSNPGSFIYSGNTIFLNVIGDISNIDFQLWKTNGTSAGTILVKDINKTGNDRASFFHDVN